MSQQLLCPYCGGFLGGEPRESYQCTTCSATSPRSALFAPARTPIDPRLDRLWNVVAGDFDRDGWFEICGWDSHTLYAIDPVDKTVMWRTLQGSTDDFDLFTGPGRIYVCTKSELIALDAHTSNRIWSAPVYNVREVHDPGYVPNGVIWVNVAHEELYAIDRSTGAVRSQTSMNDSASLFRVLSGTNLVWNDVNGIKILHPASEQLVLAIGGDAMAAMEQADAAMEELAAGRRPGKITIPDQVISAVVHRGFVYVTYHRGSGGQFLDAYRTADGKRFSRHQVTGDSLELIAAVNGHPISKSNAALKREPAGPSWLAPGKEAEIEWARGVGNVLVVMIKRSHMGDDVHDLAGLDGTTLAPLWKLDNVGYVYGELATSSSLLVLTIQGDGTQTLIGIDPASGTTRWRTNVPREEGTVCGGGLVWQRRIGTALFAETGQLIFPTDQRTTTPQVPMVELGGAVPDEAPDWGLAAPAPAARAPGAAAPSGSRALIVLLVFLAVIGIGVAVFLKMK